MQEDTTIKVSSGFFLSLFAKRSRETPANKKPVAEQDAIETSTGSHDKVELEETSETLLSDPVEKTVYECLSLRPTPFDRICDRVQLSPGEISAALTFMELSGVISRLPGDQYVRSQPAAANAAQLPDPANKALIDQVISFTRNTFQGISRKYLQNYLSLYWCHADRKRWHAGSLLELCFRSRVVSGKEILAYVTPPVVQIAVVEG